MRAATGYMMNIVDRRISDKEGAYKDVTMNLGVCSAPGIRESRLVRMERESDESNVPFGRPWLLIRT